MQTKLYPWIFAIFWHEQTSLNIFVWNNVLRQCFDEIFCRSLSRKNTTFPLGYFRVCNVDKSVSFDIFLMRFNLFYIFVVLVVRLNILETFVCSNFLSFRCWWVCILRLSQLFWRVSSFICYFCSRTFQILFSAAFDFYNFFFG